MATIGMEFGALAILLVLSAFFSGSESVFFSLNPLQLRRIAQRNPAAGQMLHAVLAKPMQVLSTILIGNTVVNTFVAALGYLIAERYVPSRGVAIAIPVMTVLLIVAGEALPKRFALLHAEGLAPLFVRPLRALIAIATPARLVLEKLTKTFESAFRPRGRTLSAEEFETALEIGGEEGIINADELAMVKSIIRLEDLHVSDVMTPRVDLLGIDLEHDPATYVAVARRARRNYLLVFRGQIDSVEGFLDVRKYLLDPEHVLARATLPPFFVPANASVVQLLMRFQREKKRIAVVVDEYGGTAGLVTRGDILEEITGEIYEELNKPRALFQAAGPGRWLVDAQISLGELNRKLSLDLKAEGADRLAGWIAEHVGHLPEKDNVVEAQGVRVTVLQTVKLRVTLAQIEKLEAPP
jgi:Mg2+/Co2+ transporter CorB